MSEKPNIDFSAGTATLENPEETRPQTYLRRLISESRENGEDEGFGMWGKERLPRLDPETGSYIDKDGQEWVALEHSEPLRNLYDLYQRHGRSGIYADVWDSAKFLFQLQLSMGCPSISVLNSNSRKVPAYPKERFDHIRDSSEANGHMSRYDWKAGEWEDENGVRWSTVPSIKDREGFTTSTDSLESWLASNCTSRSERFFPEGVLTLYPVEESERAVEEFLALPLVHRQKAYWSGVAKPGVRLLDEQGNELMDEVSVSVDYYSLMEKQGKLGLRKRFREVISPTICRDEDNIVGTYFKTEDVKAFLISEAGNDAVEEYYPEYEVRGADEEIDEDRLQRVIGVFGLDRSMDILYALHPRFRRKPIDSVNGLLTEYIGPLLRGEKGSFSWEGVRDAASLLSDASFQESLLEVLKRECLSYYQRNRGEGSENEIIDQWLADALERARELEDENVLDVVERVRQYFDTVINLIPKPDRIVDEFKEGRAFPDFYQKINIAEIAEKRRMLIADDMGMGKSASSILAKETLGLGTAVILSPSNMVETWKRYLSDEKDEDGKQLGYFKEGQAPSVLIIDSPLELQRNDFDQFDYVIISHEKLTERYVETLREVPYEMLIIDEVHELKNVSEGKRADRALELARPLDGREGYMALLSGTPAPNTIKDLAILLKLLYPEKFGDMDNKELSGKIVASDLVDLRSYLLPRMQMKSLRESHDMPEMHMHEHFVQLSDVEREVYEVMLEEDELGSFEKFALLRRFLLNPSMVRMIPDLESTKVRELRALMDEEFAVKDKVVLFANDYIEDVIRGDGSVIPQLSLSEDITVLHIDGKVLGSQVRQEIQDRFNKEPGKFLLVVSGQTAGVGVDFSGAESLIFLNEPWTKAELRQQLARSFRPGLMQELDVHTLITQGTIEEGIHYYIEIKEQLIQKLLNGLPLSDVERQIALKSDNDVTEGGLDVSPELAEYYFSAWHKMMKMFSYVRELGAERFAEFLEDHGGEYAACYQELGSRSYQANANRITATLVNRLVSEDGLDRAEVKILDLASGPEMLMQHSPERLQDSIYSVDLNPLHFGNSMSSGRTYVADMANVPMEDNTFDYVALTLALHYTRLVPTKDEIERLEVLGEINRLLKNGGKAVLNMIYSLDFKDPSQLDEAVEALGFRVVHELSGLVDLEKQYASNVLVLEKQNQLKDTLPELITLIEERRLDGLKFVRNNRKLLDSRRTISEFALGGQQFEIELNPADRTTYEEERSVILLMEDLIGQHGSIEEIPSSEVESHGLSRFLNGKKYVLFKKLQTGSGSVVIKQAKNKKPEMS